MPEWTSEFGKFVLIVMFGVGSSVLISAVATWCNRAMSLLKDIEGHLSEMREPASAIREDVAALRRSDQARHFDILK